MIAPAGTDLHSLTAVSKMFSSDTVTLQQTLQEMGGNTDLTHRGTQDRLDLFDHAPRL